MRIFIFPELKCGSIPEIENATYVTTSNDSEVGTNITFTCKTGHYLPDLNTTMTTTCEHLGGLETNFTTMPYDACSGKSNMFVEAPKFQQLLSQQLHLQNVSYVGVQPGYRYCMFRRENIWLKNYRTADIYIYAIFKKITSIPRHLR